MADYSVRISSRKVDKSSTVRIVYWNKLDLIIILKTFTHYIIVVSGKCCSAVSGDWMGIIFDFGNIISAHLNC